MLDQQLMEDEEVLNGPFHGAGLRVVCRDGVTWIRGRISASRLGLTSSFWQKFDGTVRSLVPLYETEIRGVPMLTRLSESVFA